MPEIRIAIVEDEPPARAKLRRMLAEHAGYRIVAEADEDEQRGESGIPAAGRTARDGVDELAGIERSQHVGERRHEDEGNNRGNAPRLVAPVTSGEAQDIPEGLTAKIELQTSHDFDPVPKGADRSRCENQ